MLSIEDIRMRTKDNFWFLIKMAKKYEADIPKIFGQPNQIGETVFGIACGAFSNDNSIIQFFVDNNVEINYVTLDFNLPRPGPAHAALFIKKGLNLKIIGEDGKSPLVYLEDYFRKLSRAIPPKIQKLINILPNSAYFSTDEQICTKRCPARVLILTFSLMILNSSELF